MPGGPAPQCATAQPSVASDRELNRQPVGLACDLITRAPPSLNAVKSWRCPRQASVKV